MSPKKATAVEDTQESDVAEQSEESRTGRFSGFAERVKKRSSRKPGKWSGKIGAALLILVVVGSLSALAGLFWFSYRPDRAVDADAAKAAISAASDGTIAILSYSPDTLDRDFSTARSHLTGDFLSYYDQFTQQIVAPAAKQKAVKTTAVVLRGALTEFHPDSATVLLFINQSTQSRDRPEPATTSSSVLVTLTKADGKWLISQFNPA
ncbi:twin-arginine translocation pathway signal [Mycobacterium camsae]|uniref:twin-arginine translocation pathway signal n=1 Tax=Mycobacterium gordonae TaxID=1778 RepID=UPI003216A962